VECGGERRPASPPASSFAAPSPLLPLHTLLRKARPNTACRGRANTQATMQIFVKAGTFLRCFLHGRLAFFCPSQQQQQQPSFSPSRRPPLSRAPQQALRRDRPAVLRPSTRDRAGGAWRAGCDGASAAGGEIEREAAAAAALLSPPPAAIAAAARAWLLARALSAPKDSFWPLICARAHATTRAWL
jgi:hypothetical protein